MRMRQLHDDLRPSGELGLLLLLGVLWGMPYALTKLSLATIPPLTLVAGRLVIAATVLWIVVAILGRKVPLTRSFFVGVAVQGCIGCVIPYTLIAFGQKSVDSALAAILNSTTPLFVCFVSVMWMRHEHLTVSRLAGVSAALGGVIAVAGGSSLSGLGQEIWGQAAILLATFSSACATIYGRRFSGVAPEVAAAGMLSCAALILTPASLLLETPWRSTPSALSLAALIANAAVATALGFVIYFRLIRTIGILGTASAGYLKPAVGVLIGCVVLGETVTWTMMVGLAAILAGVAVINTSAPTATVMTTERVGWRWRKHRPAV